MISILLLPKKYSAALLPSSSTRFFFHSSDFLLPLISPLTIFLTPLGTTLFIYSFLFLEEKPKSTQSTLDTHEATSLVHQAATFPRLLQMLSSQTIGSSFIPFVFLLFLLISSLSSLYLPLSTSTFFILNLSISRIAEQPVHPPPRTKPAP